MYPSGSQSTPFLRGLAFVRAEEILSSLVPANARHDPNAQPLLARGSALEWLGLRQIKPYWIRVSQDRPPVAAADNEVERAAGSQATCIVRKYPICASYGRPLLCTVAISANGRYGREAVGEARLRTSASAVAENRCWWPGRIVYRPATFISLRILIQAQHKPI